MQKEIDYQIFKGIVPFDIETVPVEKDYNKLSEIQKNIWRNRYINRKTKKYSDEYENPEMNLEGKYKSESSFFPDFSMVVCISVSRFCSGTSKEYNKKSYSFICTKHDNWQDNEKEILTNFQIVLDKMKPRALLGMNINAFDINFLQKKYMFHNIEMPKILKKSYKKSNGILTTQKSWNTDNIFLDLMWLYKGGSREFNSLHDICIANKILSSKGAIDGSQVCEYYYVKKINEIAKYCEADVEAAKQVYLKLYNSF